MIEYVMSVFGTTKHSSCNCIDTWQSSYIVLYCNLSNPSRKGAKAMANSHFGAGTGTQVLGYVNCQGNEHHLMQCPMSYTLNSQHWNYHGDDAGVICPPCTYLRDLHRYFNHHSYY